MRLEKKPPRSPFATRLSGPGRELEARLRTLFRRRRRPPVLLVVLLLAAALGCGGLVSCQGGEGDFDPVVLTTGGNTSAHASAPMEDDTFPPERASLDGLDLDGAGGKDDAVTVTSYDPNEEERTVVEVTLGDGRTLSWEYAYSCYPAVMAGYLTSEDHQCVVVEMDDRTSNYGFAA